MIKSRVLLHAPYICFAAEGQSVRLRKLIINSNPNPIMIINYDVIIILIILRVPYTFFFIFSVSASSTYPGLFFSVKLTAFY